MKHAIILTAVVSLLSACDSGKDLVISADQSQGAEVISNDTYAVDSGIVPDAVEVASPETIGPEIMPFEIEPACKPGDGCFMDPCDTGDDCLSGLCVGHMGDTVCTDLCVEECPDGWECQQIGTGPDAMFACISPYTHLCRPCETAADCKSTTGVEDVCVVFGPEGSFCGADCSGGGVCPTGYSCGNAMTVAGTQVEQCVPDAGICECSNSAIKLGLATLCFVENEFGVCTGQRICGHEGLSDCDAGVPSEEVCDGVDNDCDGDVDEGAVIDGQAQSICDDGDTCTQDQCDAALGCVNAPLSGTDCNDEDVCTLADHCEDGECNGTPISCEDGNICTSDSCDPLGGCVYAFNNSGCDDDDPCTINDTCSQGSCEGFEVPCECQTHEDCLALEDGDVCNGTLYCDFEAFPQKCEIDPATVVVCPPPLGVGSECLGPACHPVTGECSYAAANEGKACSDGDACTMGEACAQGACSDGFPVNCNDGNPCTDDSCNQSQGCQYDDNQSPCDDDDVCTVEDTCGNGGCISGKPLDCDDGNPCTMDACDPLIGCTHEHGDGQCSDGNLCTTEDTCVTGQCVGLGMLDCDDQNPCTNDACNPALGCTHTNNTQPCDDGNECTLGENCQGGMCLGGAPVNCNDGNLCTDDLCDPQGGCTHEHNANPCNDADPCTTTDVCIGGQCVGAGNLNCNDGNPCTDDLCEAGGGCKYVDNSIECNDGNPCTTGDKCSNSACQGTGNLDCDDKNICTNDSCSPEKGCTHDANDNPCNDGDACTTGDICGDGFCKGPGKLECDDSNPCTDDDCDANSGCTHDNNTAVCDDNNECTTGDKCNQGACIGAGSLECDDGNPCTKDICLPNGGCQNEPIEGPCSDGTACTVGDKCAEGICKPGPAPNCDDSNPCTDDSCNVDSGCVHAHNTTQCSDGSECTLDDICKDGTCLPGPPADCNDDNICTTDYCDPGVGCIHNVNDQPCDDGNACTVGDVCQTGACVSGAILSCNDGNVCTTDECDTGAGCSNTPNNAPCSDNNACTVDDTCANGGCQPGAPLDCGDNNFCTDDSCHPASGCQNLNNVAPCDDGNVCTMNDKCNAGACKPGLPMDCNDNNVCTDDSCNPLAGCAYSNNSGGCDDSNECTTGDKCGGGECKPGAALQCADGNHCTTDSCDPQSGCVYPPISPCCGDGIKEGGEGCDDGNLQNGDGCDSNCNQEVACQWADEPQLYCNGWCSWAGPDNCDQADADLFCKLKTCNCNAKATSFDVVKALAQPGFSCNPGYGVNLGKMPQYCVNVDVWHQNSSILANHGPGWVVTNVKCSK